MTSKKTIAALLTAISLVACSENNEPVAGQVVDLIIEGDYVVTMDADGSIIADGAVAINDGEIVAVGTRDAIHVHYVAGETLAGKDRIVMPGLVNGHSHAAMTLLRGVADDLELMEWLTNYIFPAEVEFVDAEFVRIGTELACWEMIRGGTTTFVDMYYYSDAVAEAVEACGMRALVSASVIGQRSPDAEGATDGISKGTDFITRWQGRNSRITPFFAPHAVYTLNAEQLAATRDAANTLNAPISIHLAESPFEIGYSTSNYGVTPVAMLDGIGFFDGPTIAAHMVWPTEEEIAILAEKGVGVIHNPSSNTKLASGVSPVANMLAAGVKMGIGTDGAASNNDLDLWEEMRMASFLQKVDQMDPKVLPAMSVLRMATSGGADAVGLGDVIGVIEPGKRADVIQVAFDDVHHVPMFNVVSHLVYVTDEQDVASVVVDGKVLMKEREILTIDTERVRAEAIELAGRIQAALDARNSPAP